MKEISVVITMDCEPSTATSHPKATGPRDWAMGERAVLGYAGIAKEYGFPCTFFVHPETILAQADLFRQLEREGHCVGLHMHPWKYSYWRYRGERYRAHFGDLSDAEATALRIRGSRVEGAETESGFQAAGAVIVAAGAWSGMLLSAFGPGFGIEPVRGQIALLRGRPGLLAAIVGADCHYLIPRRDGRILAGSTVERAGFDKTTTREAVDELAAAARSLIPALSGAPVETAWAGLRPGSPGGIPLIGPHPSVEGLFLNPGHYRNGLFLAPGSAALLADLVLQRPPLLDPAPYLPR